MIVELGVRVRSIASGDLVSTLARRTESAEFGYVGLLGMLWIDCREEFCQEEFSCTPFTCRVSPIRRVGVGACSPHSVVG